jgi:phosphomevalonate kinase
VYSVHADQMLATSADQHSLHMRVSHHVCNTCVLCQQTRLADATSALSGVLCSGVPGAGGVDAIYAITIHDSAATAVQALWSQWTTASDSEADSAATANIKK